MICGERGGERERESPIFSSGDYFLRSPHRFSVSMATRLAKDKINILHESLPTVQSLLEWLPLVCCDLLGLL